MLRRRYGEEYLVRHKAGATPVTFTFLHTHIHFNTNRTVNSDRMQVGVLMFLQTAATCRQDFSHLLITVGKCSADLLERNVLLEIIVSSICVRTMVLAQEVI